MAKEKEKDIRPFAIFPGPERSLLLDRISDSLRWDRFEYAVLKGEEVIGRIYFDEKAVGSTVVLGH